MPDRIVTLAYIGNGKSTNRYHAPFVLDRPDEFRIKTIQARHVDHSSWEALPGVRYTTNVEDVLGDPEVDVVEVTTPSALHYEMAKMVLEAGKSVVVDKPFAASYDQAAELFELASERGLMVQCYQNRRFDSDYLTARAVVASGRLGRVFEVVTSYDYYRPWQKEGQRLDVVTSAAFEHATHCVDQLIDWFGIPDRSHADLRQLQGAGMANDYFDFDLYYDDRGLKCTAHSNYLSAIQRPSFEVYGTKGCFIKVQKDQQERDLKHFYLPVGHDDFGLDAPEQYGLLRCYDDEGAFHEERVPTVRSSYARWYDALYRTVVEGSPQLVKPEETLAQMRILEDGVSRLS